MREQSSIPDELQKGNEPQIQQAANTSFRMCLVEVPIDETLLCYFDHDFRCVRLDPSTPLRFLRCGCLCPIPVATLKHSYRVEYYLSMRNASVAHEVFENRMKSNLLPYVLLRIMRRFPLRSTGSALVCICLLCSIWPRCPNTDATKSRRPLP